MFRLIKKISNYIAIQLQYRLGVKRIRGYPYVLIVDTINVCNLKCPLCPTGLNLPGRAKGRMKLDKYKKIIDELGDYAFTIVLHNWGEPLLNKDIFPMIAYTRQKKINTILSSNLNLLSEEDAELLVDSGLDELIVSLDGVNSETYDQYRKGGNYEQVIKNIELLVQKKRQKNKVKPKIVWQFLVFKHNIHEVERAKQMAIRLQVDHINIFSGQLGGVGQTPYIGHENTKELASRWLVRDKKYMGEFDYFAEPEYLCDKKCYYLWKSTTINWDGSVSPCCCVYEPSTDFGNINEKDFLQVWNNELFQSARSLFTRSDGNSSQPATICQACKIFKKHD